MSMQPLKLSTASQVAILGPFLDPTDGVTPETALSIANTDIRLYKHGATSAVNKNSGGATAIENGYYHCTFNATDTDTAGRLRVAVNESGAAPLWEDFIVLPADVYDAWISDSGVGVRSDVQSFGGAAGTFAGGRPEINLAQWLGTAPLALASQRVVTDVGAISGDSAAADTLELYIENFVRTSGTAQTGAASTITLALADGAADDRYVGNVIGIIAGAGAGQWRKVSDYVSATKVATVSQNWETNPDNTSQYLILAGPNEGASALTAAGIADAVWDELLAGHAIVGSAGAALAAASAGGDPWATPLPGAYADGTAGQIIGEIGAEVAEGLATVTYPEPSVVPSFPMSPLDMWRWVAALAIHRLIQSSSQIRLRDAADTVDVAAAQVQDSGGVFTRGAWG